MYTFKIYVPSSFLFLAEIYVLLHINIILNMVYICVVNIIANHLYFSFLPNLTQSPHDFPIRFVIHRIPLFTLVPLFRSKFHSVFIYVEPTHAQTFNTLHRTLQPNQNKWRLAYFSSSISCSNHGGIRRIRVGFEGGQGWCDSVRKGCSFVG